MKYKIELNDSDGNSCKIQVSLPLIKVNARPTNSTWRVLDEGFFRKRSGGCNMIRTELAGDGDLQLIVGQAYGVTIQSFIDGISAANDSGEGYAEPDFCLNFKGGYFTWALI